MYQYQSAGIERQDDRYTRLVSVCLTDLPSVQKDNSSAHHMLTLIYGVLVDRFDCNPFAQNAPNATKDERRERDREKVKVRKHFFSTSFTGPSLGKCCIQLFQGFFFFFLFCIFSLSILFPFSPFLSPPAAIVACCCREQATLPSLLFLFAPRKRKERQERRKKKIHFCPLCSLVRHRRSFFSLLEKQEEEGRQGKEGKGKGDSLNILTAAP